MYLAKSVFNCVVGCQQAVCVLNTSYLVWLCFQNKHMQLTPGCNGSLQKENTSHFTFVVLFLQVSSQGHYSDPPAMVSCHERKGIPTGGGIYQIRSELCQWKPETLGIRSRFRELHCCFWQEHGVEPLKLGVKGQRCWITIWFFCCLGNYKAK